MSSETKASARRLRRRARAYELRESLFFIPMLLVLAAAGLAFVARDLDRRIAVESLPRFLRISESASTTLLGTIAGATITTAGVVFSITVVSIQLASGQFSPRVVRGLLRDRVGQVVIGTLMATFIYSVVSLHRPGAFTALGAEVLAFSSVVMIVVYLDHATRSLYVGEVAARIADETITAAKQMCSRTHFGPEDQMVAGHDDPKGLGEPWCVPSLTDGWIQLVSDQGVMSAVAAASTVRVETRPGAFVQQGQWILTVWPAPSPNDRTRIAKALQACVVIGDQRTMQEDLDFGIRQLNDIALRAVSPAVNDPTTAIECVLRVSSVLRQILLRDLPPQVKVGPAGTRVLRPWDLDHAELIRHAFEQIRLPAADHPYIAMAVCRSLRLLERTVLGHDRPQLAPPLRHQLDLLLEQARRRDHLEADMAAIEASAA